MKLFAPPPPPSGENTGYAAEHAVKIFIFRSEYFAEIVWEYQTDRAVRNLFPGTFNISHDQSGSFSHKHLQC